MINNMIFFFFLNNPKQKETVNKTQAEENSQAGSVLKDKKPQSVSETNKKQEYWTYNFNQCTAHGI